MRAAVIHEYGPPEVLEIEEHPEPEVGPRDVLIRVRASSVNPIDWKIRSGAQRAAIRYRLPWILGLDVSGEIIEIGSEVSRFKLGDEVYSSPSHKRWGCYAERVAIDEREVAKKPHNLSHLEAASIPLVGLTAWQCLEPKLRGRPDQRVLIQAGSGGVGTFAIQLAKHWNAWIATTCSPRNHQMVSDLGADQMIDYRTQAFQDAVSDLDLVLDALGPETRDTSFQIVKRGGRIASITSGMPANTKRYGPNLGLLVTILQVLGFKLRGLARGVDAAMVVKRCDADDLDEICGRLEAGVIRPVIDRSFPMEEVAAAHTYMETGRARGKVVLEGFPD